MVEPLLKLWPGCRKLAIGYLRTLGPENNPRLFPRKIRQIVPILDVCVRVYTEYIGKALPIALKISCSRPDVNL